MYDPNVFAVIFPQDDRELARNSFRLSANAHYYHDPAKSVDKEPAISSREATPASQGSLPDGLDPVDHILLTFDKKPKDLQRGWQFGSNLLSSDILLRGTKGVAISRQHLYLTINEKFRVELHDNSLHGSSVGYDGKAKFEVRIKDKWILALEPGRESPWKEVIVYVPDATRLGLKFKFPNHEAGRPEYMANLRAFLEERRTPLPPSARSAWIVIRLPKLPVNPRRPVKVQST